MGSYDKDLGRIMIKRAGVRDLLQDGGTDSSYIWVGDVVMNPRIGRALGGFHNMVY